MRIINGLLFVLMLLYVAVQYNDPDFFVWMPIYAVPAIWAAIGAFRPAALLGNGAMLALGACVVASAVGVVAYWPQEPEFWKQDVWWDSETAREGLGMMTVLLVLVIVAITVLVRRARR